MSDIEYTKEKLLKQAIKVTDLDEAICLNSLYAPYNGILVSWFSKYGIVDLENATVELLPSYVGNMESAALHIRNCDEIFKAGAMFTANQNDHPPILKSISA
ncbi:MAG: hypothetical protein ACJAS1_006704 [Oleiphilaceae bacterium]|jgi:hypothetical protein